MRALLVCVLMLLGACAFADGMYFPVEKQPDPKLPSQRALISYRDGVETLIVESHVDGPKGDYAWVLPLPAKPTKVEAATKGMLNSVFERMSVQIDWGLMTGITGICSLVVVFVIGVGVIMRSRGKKEWALLVVGSVGWFFPSALVAIFVMMVTSGSGGCSASTPGEVKATAWQDVGAYETAIVEGKTGAAIRDWLTNNKFAVPASAVAILDQYSKDGWCFLAARIRKDDSGVAQPHPIKVVFPTANAVYPMRLTALANKPVHVDLTIVGDGSAVIKPLERLRTKVQDKDPVPHWDKENGYRDQTEFGHPKIAPLMWKGSAVTRLRATLTPEQMASDLYVAWTSPKPYAKVFFASHETNTAIVALGLGVTAFVTLIRNLIRFFKGQICERAPFVFVASVLLVSFALAFGASWFFPSLDATLHGPPDADSRYQNMQSALSELSEAKAEAPFPEQYREALKKKESDYGRSKTRLLKFESDTPGGFQIRELEPDKWDLVLYDSCCRPVKYQVKRKGDGFVIVDQSGERRESGQRPNW